MNNADANRVNRAEQWVRRLADDWEFDEGKHLTTFLAEYDDRGHEITRLQAIITRYETGAQQILHKIKQEANR